MSQPADHFQTVFGLLYGMRSHAVYKQLHVDASRMTALRAMLDSAKLAHFLGMEKVQKQIEAEIGRSVRLEPDRP